MSSRSQSGYALALLLWMITGMSLMVTAVIHFARDDIGLSELRINEAKSRALARGLGYLVSRDRALEEFQSLRRGAENEGEDASGSRGRGNAREAQRQRAGSFNYRFDRVSGIATIRPPSSLVALNNASEEELFRTLVALGQAESGQAMNIMRGIIDYRNQASPVSRQMTDFRGYRFKEELLTTGGMTRSVYDRVKDFVHVHRTAGLIAKDAPPALAAIFAGEKMAYGAALGVGGDGGADLKSASSAPLAAGPVTFDSVYEARRAARNPEADVNAVTVQLSFDNGFQSRYLVWMSGSGGQLVRAERLSASQQESF
jgi:hypothetical protein